jgi:hypothetical protein
MLENNEQMSYLNAHDGSSANVENNNNNLPSSSSSSSSPPSSSALTCEFGDRQNSNFHHQLDKSFASMNLTQSYGNNRNELMSPMLVNKHNYSTSNLDVNNNNNNNNCSESQSFCVNLLNENGYISNNNNNNGDSNSNLNQRSSFQFDCFDVTYKGS